MVVVVYTVSGAGVVDCIAVVLQDFAGTDTVVDNIVKGIAVIVV